MKDQIKRFHVKAAWDWRALSTNPALPRDLRLIAAECMHKHLRMAKGA